MQYFEKLFQDIRLPIRASDWVVTHSTSPEVLPYTQKEQAPASRGGLLALSQDREEGGIQIPLARGNPGLVVVSIIT